MKYYTPTDSQTHAQPHTHLHWVMRIIDETHSGKKKLEGGIVFNKMPTVS